MAWNSSSEFTWPGAALTQPARFDIQGEVVVLLAASQIWPFGIRILLMSNGFQWHKFQWHNIWIHHIFGYFGIFLWTTSIFKADFWHKPVDLEM